MTDKLKNKQKQTPENLNMDSTWLNLQNSNVPTTKTVSRDTVINHLHTVIIFSFLSLSVSFTYCEQYQQCTYHPHHDVYILSKATSPQRAQDGS